MTTTKEALVVGGLPVEVVRRDNLKNLYVRIMPPDGDVVVSSPRDMKEDMIRLFVIKKMREITQVRTRMQSQERQTKREYVSGESHYLWGKAYRLQVVCREGTPYVEKTPSKIILYVPGEADEKKREAVLQEWYRAELKRVLDTVREQCERRTGLQADSYRIKNMRTRWGTCNPEDRRIWLNLQLAKKPVECLEYVLIHELVHLLEKNHTHRFHGLVERYCPNWKEARKLLAKMPLEYMEHGEDATNDEYADIERYL